MHGIQRLLCAFGIGLGLLAASTPASADDATPEQEQAVAKLDENRASYQSAQAKLAELEAEYTRGMTSHDLVGEPREKVVQGIAEAKRQLTAARGAHDGLLEAARACGVPWSVLDRYEELPAPPAAQEPTAEDQPDHTGSENADSVEDAGTGDSDALEGEAENVDAAPDSGGENPDSIVGVESKDPDDMRATSREPD